MAANRLLRGCRRAADAIGDWWARYVRSLADGHSCGLGHSRDRFDVTSPWMHRVELRFQPIGFGLAIGGDAARQCGLVDRLAGAPRGTDLARLRLPERAVLTVPV